MTDFERMVLNELREANKQLKKLGYAIDCLRNAEGQFAVKGEDLVRVLKSVPRETTLDDEDYSTKGG